MEYLIFVPCLRHLIFQKPLGFLSLITNRAENNNTRKIPNSKPYSLQGWIYIKSKILKIKKMQLHNLDVSELNLIFEKQHPQLPLLGFSINLNS
jgi:hypothetical protein